jgi:hypothetical protein
MSLGILTCWYIFVIPFGDDCKQKDFSEINISIYKIEQHINQNLLSNKLI